MDLIVAFPSGASGRFITSIITWLLYDIQTSVTYHTHNSVHNLGHESANSWIADKTVSDLHDSKVYETLEFVGSLPHRIFWTHAFPDINVIHSRLPNAKIVIITFTESDIEEISVNSKYKNDLPFPPEIDHKFNRNNVHTAHNTLIIPYREILNIRTLSVLANFIGKQSNHIVAHNYQTYIDGQSQFLFALKSKI
jgi:hypothetical protein